MNACGATGTRYQAATLIRAQELHAAGWPIVKIADLLERELGARPCRDTILGWVDPAYAQRRDMRQQRYNTRRWAARWTFQLGGERMSTEYRAAFARRLRDEGVPVESIARVCGVVFGGDWTGDHVRKLIAGSEA
jgi:hypothetical protein